MTTCPANKTLSSETVAWFDRVLEAAYVQGQDCFDGLRNDIRNLENGLEAVLVGTHWPVIMLVICALALQLAGAQRGLHRRRTGLPCLLRLPGVVYTIGRVAERGLDPVHRAWHPSRHLVRPVEDFFSVALPVLDFVQTMQAFVYLIQAIAFFGTAKPPGIIDTLIFGMPPVICLTTLGLTGVPEDVKETARAYGATEWQVLRGVELHLAKASILAGINQTVLICLSMVVIASLVGAQGLGLVVLTSLQYSANGPGLLAGLAILLCAMVIDRIIRGGFRKRE